MSVLVYGLGRSGRAAATLLRRQGREVLLYDANPDPDEVAQLQALGCSWTDAPRDAKVEQCIAAPGVPWDHPDLCALRARQIDTIGEVEWVQRTIPATLIGITGTAGKTTVTRWLEWVLQRAGHDAVAGGNVDPALAAVAAEGKTLVVELSSFQLERCPTLKPKVAVLLNLGEDHLDRHRSVAAYHAAKYRLIANLDAHDTLVFNQDDPTVRRWAEASPAQCVGYSLRESAHGYLDRTTQELVIALPHETLRMNVQALQVNAQHYYSNALAVALSGAALGLSREQIRTGLTSFSGVPGRYSLVAQVAGVRFIEDSIATRTLAVKAALEATPGPIAWIAGGQDKGARFEELAALIERKVVLFLAIGSCAAAFATHAARYSQTRLCQDPDGERALADAVRQAFEFLARHHPGEGTVLLAPLAASFDQFRDYRHRAEAFRRAVREMEVSWTPYSY